MRTWWRASGAAGIILHARIRWLHWQNQANLFAPECTSHLGFRLVGEENHAVTEGDTISFDVDVENERGDCIIPFPFTVSTEPSTGTALLETGDQASKSQRFPACTASKTFEFQTVATPGTQADQTITFDIERATNTDSRISLEGQSSVHQYTVTVQNNGN